MDNKTAQIVRNLKNIENGGSFSAAVGFDGFIDKIVRVVKTREDETNFTTYTSITDFASRIAQAAGNASDMELIAQTVKAGGNAPLMADALSWLGAKTTCVGAMGYPEINKVFDTLNHNCELISICGSGESTAFEFDDGKLMFAELTSLDQISSQNLKTLNMYDNIISSFAQSSLNAFVNWSLLINVSAVWELILEELSLREIVPDKHFFFDIADPSKRSPEDLLEALGIMNKFARLGEVTLGLNGNEMRQVLSCLKRKNNAITADPDASDKTELERCCRAIYDNLNIQSLVVHFADWSVNITENGLFSRQGRLVRKPKLTTGGGDNFNAGYCFARMNGFDEESCLIIAMGVSGYYVKNGRSPDVEGLCEYLELTGEQI